MLGIDQKRQAELAGVSMPTIQCMEASGNMRGVVETLTEVVEALDHAGVVLLADAAASVAGGQDVRLKEDVLPRRREA